MDSESWNEQHIEELKEKIENFLKEDSSLSDLLEKTDKVEEKSKILEKLVTINNDLRVKYKELEVFEKIDYKKEINRVLKKQIKFFEQRIEVLTEKYKTEEIPYSYYLKLANLHYKYLDFNREEIIKNSKFHEGVFAGVSPIPVPEINSIINNIHLAMHNVQKIIREKRQTLDFETLYIYFEINGDLFLHIYVIENELEEFSAFAELYNIDNAFECYEKAMEYKSKVELPSIALGGLVVQDYLKPFYKFFEENGGNIYTVGHKKNFLYKKFANYLERKTKSYCWKTGDYCEHKKDIIYNLDEGNGVFISMNYSRESNFELLSYIKKVLKFFKLNPILKQERIRSPSWTKEICCTIYNNKFAIVFLDKYSPNVVLELGVCLGMGRKVLILINEAEGALEQKLFSMIKDYDCITYKNASDLFTKLIRSIYGVFFDRIDYKMPDIKNIFNKNEIDNLNSLIQTHLN